MVHRTFYNNSIFSISYALNGFGKGRLSLPVEPAALVYSHFKHVSGVPAPEGSRGVSINRLNILDTLIEQMNQMKKNGTPIFPAKIPESKPDTIIEAYQTQILQAVETQPAMPYISALQAQTGAVFNFMV